MIGRRHVGTYDQQVVTGWRRPQTFGKPQTPPGKPIHPVGNAVFVLEIGFPGAREVFLGPAFGFQPQHFDIIEVRSVRHKLVDAVANLGELVQGVVQIVEFVTVKCPVEQIERGFGPPPPLSISGCSAK